MRKNKAISPLARFIEQNFLKFRIVFALEKDHFIERKLTNSEYVVSTFSLTSTKTDGEKTRKTLDFLSIHLGKDKALSRLKRDDCKVFIAEAKTGELVGYYWSLSPKLSEVWHDKFKVNPGSALLFNAFVVPEHRRRRVYESLQIYSHDYLFRHENCKTVYTIVEQSNKASLAANVKFGLHATMENILIKIMGINFLSIYWHGHKLSLHWVFRNEQGFNI
jgi:hypothetical protein